MTKDEIDRLAAELEKQLKDLDSKRKEIQEKIRNLSHQRKAFTVAENAFGPSLDRPVSEISSVSQKIALFRSFIDSNRKISWRRLR